MAKPVKQLDNQKLWIVGLLLVMIFVIFILPNRVSEPWLTDSSVQAVAPVQTDSLAPSTIAEKTRYRQQSQSLLASILALRDKLLKQSVTRWANSQFSNTLTLIEEGDSLYSFGKYKESLNSYEQALAELKQLEQLATDTFEQALERGNAAIERADTTDIPTAIEAASLALSIYPEDSRAQRLNQRTEKLTTLVEALSQGDSQLSQQQYEQALISYQTALAIEPGHKRAQTSFDETQRTIKNRNFVAFMSDGYTALDMNNFELAVDNFKQAKAIYSADSRSENLHSIKTVEQAIAQVNNRRSQLYVQQQMATAAQQETQEQWKQAQLTYQQLLTTDSTLVEAKARLVRVKIRAQLDQQITSVLDDPLSLANQNLYSDAQSVLLDARGINNPGPKLQEQIELLQGIIKRSQIPVTIGLLSDNQTQVTIYRVGKLGAFQEISVQLVPGRYIAVGSRKGYRDVRVELTVEGVKPVAPIPIICTEKI